MPHQDHFLSRLDRLSLPQVELSLSLYRDPAVVRYVLSQVRLPDGAPRVAISLDDPARGPFLVVTREGIFVTCLGLDMSSGDLPVVLRGQLDAFLAKAGDWRARADTFLRVAGEVGGGSGVFARLFEAADNLSREEMIAVTALQPLFETKLFKLLVDSVIELEKCRNAVLPILRKAPKLSGNNSLVLRAYWKTAWMVGHLSLLAGMSGPKLLDTFGDAAHKELEGMGLSWGAVRQGMGALALRGAWLAGRVGKALLPHYKQAFPGAKSPLTALNVTLSLSALAFRHGRLRAEIEKVIHTAAAAVEELDRAPTFAETVTKVADMVLQVESAKPTLVADQHVAMGAELVMMSTRHVPKGSAFAFEREQDVPRDLAFTMAVNAVNSLVENTTFLAPLFAMLPWASRAAPEDFYLPRDFLKATRMTWTPHDSYALLRPLAEMYKPAAPVQTGPARKGPCPCGSGEKYKRCCGAEA